VSIRAVAGNELSAGDLYLVWGIRDSVFAFEQHVEDVDVDGLDLCADTLHIWLADDDGLTSYLRILCHREGHKVGRVCTRADVRGQGLSGRLMSDVSARFGSATLALNAQAYLEKWYDGFGYVRSGPNFDEAGIDHVPMVRKPNQA